MAEPAFALKQFRGAVAAWQPQIKKAASALLVKTAREGHARIMARQPASTWVAFGDVPGKSWEHAEQMIVFKYSDIRAVIIAILKLLRDNSPVESGRYKSSHTLYVDGVPRTENTPIRPGQQVMIGNPLPYAARLEFGKTHAGRAFSAKANHLYERTSKIAQGMFRTVDITFGSIRLPGTSARSGGRTISRGGSNRHGVIRWRRRSRPNTNPVIFIGRRELLPAQSRL